ncbi:CDP-diacylglycerol--serine O-phosphatidyltransferase [Candidatus Liberibacter americanus]|uniref:CDP-diacylglycerol--serine O-phosphatidyltransferase n=1 Tax=Candidatus Liberibacter americanus str. Sao Paulo TaxID=1261131 RepID=U6B8Y9_9HYPH|nr:CDP-diacylglycerol--serine O-phosphatidyltransferase [Candidatus Liberibacter americanus]AHA28326.1 Phosphatidylserine synthase [Candidatus Liberibacter americanus str. Sao Paulo]EMS36616.1 phosphatidylserine synthase [Candidatus Liberibacter americanus PW_SP]
MEEKKPDINANDFITKHSQEIKGDTQEKDIMPLKLVFPNLVTILAICSGFSGIGSALEGKYEKAVFMILIAAFLDGIDGRIARFMKATSKFGEQLDSIADVINFGIAPALVLYISLLSKANTFGWSIALMYTIATSLRLARFNIMNESSHKEPWEKEYFIGVPAPLGAILLMLPLYITFLGINIVGIYIYLSTIYAMIISFLLCSKLPIWSFKEIQGTIRKDLVLPIILCVTPYIAFMIHFLWEVIIISVLSYIILIPVSYYSCHKKYHKLNKKITFRNTIF